MPNPTNSTALPHSPPSEPTGEPKYPATHRYVFDYEAGDLATKLGEGAFGHVYLGKDLKTSKAVALKIPAINLGKPLEDAKGIESFFDQEIENLLRISHVRNVLKYLDDSYIQITKPTFFTTSARQTVSRIIQIDQDDEISDSLDNLNETIDKLRSGTSNREELRSHRKKLRDIIRSQKKGIREFDVDSAVLVNGLRCLVTERYRLTLESLASIGAISTESILQLLENVLGAIVQLHWHGIRHGDISPDNIMFDGEEITDDALKQEPEIEKEVRRHQHSFYSWRAILIDLGLILHNPRSIDRTCSSPIVFKLIREKGYAPAEALDHSLECKGLKSYRIEHQKSDPHERVFISPATLVTPFGYKPFDNIAERRGAHADLQKEVGQQVKPGDLLHNARYAFTVKSIEKECIELTEPVYSIDSSSFAKQITVSQFAAAYAHSLRTQSVETSILRIRKGYGIPADLFSFCACVAFMFFTRNSEKPDVFGLFISSLRRGNTRNLTVEDWINEQDNYTISEMQAVFAKEGLLPLFNFVLRGALRGDPSKGYFCSSHADDRLLCSVRAMSQFVEIRREWAITEYLRSNQHDLQRKHSQARQRLEKQCRDLRRQLAAVTAVDEEFEEAQRQLNSEKEAREQLETRCAELDASLTSTNQAKRQLETRCAELDASLTSASQAKRQFETRCAELDASLTSASQAERQLETRCVELDANLTAANQAKRQLETRCTELDASLISANEARQQFEKKCTELDSNLMSANQANRQLKATLVKLKMLNGTLSRTKEDLEVNNEQLQTTLDSTEEARSALAREYDGLVIDKKNMTDQLSHVQERLDSANARFQNLKREVSFAVDDLASTIERKSRFSSLEDIRSHVDALLDVVERIS